MKFVLTLLGFFALTAVIVVGFEYRVPFILALISLGLSLFSLVAGVRMIVTRTAELPTSDTDDTKHEHYRGVTAVLWGILFLMVAAPFAIYSVGYFMFGLESVDDAFGRVVRSRHAGGLLGAVVGVGFLLFGLTRLLGGKAAFAETTIGEGRRIAGGMFASALGSLIVTAGIMESIMPGSFTRMRDAAIAWALALAK